MQNCTCFLWNGNSSTFSLSQKPTEQPRRRAWVSQLADENPSPAGSASPQRQSRPAPWHGRQPRGSPVQLPDHRSVSWARGCHCSLEWLITQQKLFPLKCFLPGNLAVKISRSSLSSLCFSLSGDAMRFPNSLYTSSFPLKSTRALVPVACTKHSNWCAAMSRVSMF